MRECSEQKPTRSFLESVCKETYCRKRDISKKAKAVTSHRQIEVLCLS